MVAKTRTKAQEDEIVDVAVKAAEGAELLAERSPAIVPDPDGYYHDANWITVTCDWPSLAPRAGFAPLQATFDASLTFQEAIAIPISVGRPMLDLFVHLEHRIRDWNVREFDPVTKSMVPVPPPSEIGKAAFFRCNKTVVEWLAVTLQDMSLNGGPNRKNVTTPSDPGLDGPSDAA